MMPRYIFILFYLLIIEKVQGLHEDGVSAFEYENERTCERLIADSTLDLKCYR